MHSHLERGYRIPAFHLQTDSGDKFFGIVRNTSYIMEEAASPMNGNMAIHISQIELQRHDSASFFSALSEKIKEYNCWSHLYRHDGGKRDRESREEKGALQLNSIFEETVCIAETFYRRW